MKVKKIRTGVFYETMVEWFDLHNFPHVNPSMLPEYTFVCFNDKEEPAYSVCFYNTDSHLAWLGFPLSNTKVEREGCFNYLFEKVEKYAKINGYVFLFTTSNTKPVEEELINSSFLIGDTNVNHYLKVI